MALALLALAGPASATTTPPDFSDTQVASVPSPTALASTPDGRILIGTQDGKIQLYKNGALQPTPALDLTSAGVCYFSERGLLGVAVDPAFATNHFIYTYSTRKKSDGACVNRVSRFTMNGDVVEPSSEVALIDNIFVSAGGGHSGGDVFFGKDGFLYVSVGDGYCDYTGTGGCAGNNDASRDKNVPLGKILRVTRDGAIPASNPYASSGGRCNTGNTTPGKFCQETFAWGLRNPFRFAFDPNATGTRFFINDVGQNNWEEIDDGQAGADYGYNVREGHCATGSYTDCGPQPAGMTNPIFDYSHQGECTGITGGAFVPSGLWPSPYSGSYLYSDYVCGKIFRLVPKSGGGYDSTEFVSGLGSSSAVALAFGPYGASQALYYTSYAGGGEVRRIAYTGSLNHQPTAKLTASPTSGPVPLTVSFDGSGSSDPDLADVLTYVWDFGDGSPPTETLGPKVDHTYTAHASQTATLRVRDAQGATSDPATVRIDAGNTPPTPKIEAPADTLRFAVGQDITLRGSATDPDEGTLPDSRLSWEVVRVHNQHTHPFLPTTDGNNVHFTAPGPEDFAAAANSYLEIRLTATDSNGGSKTVTQALRPNAVQLTFATNPSGLKLSVAGSSIVAPQTFTSWEGDQVPVEAQGQFDSSNRYYRFSSWSDGGGAAHKYTTPASDATLTASFQQGVYRDAVFNSPGLISYWRLGESSGTTAADEKGANPGSYVGGVTLGQPGALMGDPNTSARFDGTNDELTAGGASLALGAEGTLEGWFYWEAGVALMRDSTTTAGWILAYDANGKLAYRAAGLGATTSRDTSTVRNGWHHYALVKSGPSLALYVDGALVHNSTGAPSGSAKLPWHVMRNGTLNQFTRGRADELAAYNRALSASEVQQHYQAGTG
jgi:glucose/arabinose dehydrogenase